MSETITLDETHIDIVTGKPHNVILFNDEHHSMEEVAAQIVLAIKCTTQRAIQIMNEAHKKGRAIVFSGSLERCELVSSILEEIRLGTKIEKA